MPTTVHVGISIEGLRRLLNDPVVLKTMIKYGESIVAWAEELQNARAEGKAIISNCPTPLPDGSCPGHPK